MEKNFFLFQGKICLLAMDYYQLQCCTGVKKYIYCHLFVVTLAVKLDEILVQTQQSCSFSDLTVSSHNGKLLDFL